MRSYRWYAGGDVNATFGLVVDNMTNLVVLAGLLIGVFHFPADLVLYRIPRDARPPRAGRRVRLRAGDRGAPADRAGRPAHGPRPDAAGPPGRGRPHARDHPRPGERLHSLGAALGFRGRDDRRPAPGRGGGRLRDREPGDPLRRDPLATADRRGPTGGRSR